MRCHKVTWKDEDFVRYAGTAAGAKATRDAVMAAEGVKRSAFTIEQTEIPTDKEGLLSFINALLAEKGAR